MRRTSGVLLFVRETNKDDDRKKEREAASELRNKRGQVSGVRLEHGHGRARKRLQTGSR
jgi:hypothetical protein